MRRFQSSPKYAWLPLLIITMTAVAALIGWLASRTVESRQVASTGDSLALAASAIADDLDLFLDERLGYLSVAASTLVFKQHDPAAMNEYLKAVRSASHNTFLWLGATDAAGRIIASTEPSILGQDRRNSVWFQAVRGARMTSVGDVGTFTETGGVEAMSLAVPITDPQGTFLGTVAAQMGIPALEEVATRTIRSVEEQRYLPGTFEYQFLLRDGFAFIDSDLLHKGNVNLKHLGLRSAILAESGQPGYLEEDHLRRHVPVVTGYARTQGGVGSANFQWSILLRMDRNEILAPTRAALQNLAIVGTVIWLPMIMLLLWTTGHLMTERQQAQDESAHARAAEMALRETRERTRLILDHALDAVVGMDSHGTITDWNPRAETMFGWTQAEAMGRKLAETIIPPHYRDAHERGLRRFLAGGEGPLLNKRVEMTALRRDGTEFPIELSISHLKTGESASFSAFVADITERKRAEEVRERLLAELEESRNRFEMIFHKTPSAIAIMTAREGRFLDVNKQAEILTGYSREELLGRTILELGLYPDSVVRPKIVAQVQEKGVLTDLERPIRTKSGEIRTAIFSLVPIQMGHEPCVLSIAHDITERRRAEEMLRTSEQTLRTVLNEREQLMQDLHDGLIQSLYAIGMSTEECRRLISEDPLKADVVLGQAVDDVNAVIREVRNYLAQDEHDTPLSAARLKAELTRVAGTMERANALHFRLKVDQRAATVLTTEERKEILYIAQEAMSNCLRHSGASVANVSLQLGRNYVRLEIEDDGVGFDREVVLASANGLRNIEQRAAKVGATVAIVSRREHGTRIRLDVPVHAQSRSRP